MKTITWIAKHDGNQYIATNCNGMEVGRIRFKLGKSTLPILAVSANGTTKSFALLHHATDWVEELYSVVADAIENA